jgi:hypothetical protein
MDVHASLINNSGQDLERVSFEIAFDNSEVHFDSLRCCIFPSASQACSFKYKLWGMLWYILLKSRILASAEKEKGA